MNPAIRRPLIQSPPPICATMSAVAYWTTEAATAKDMSIPPAISTTSKPTAKMILTALVLSRSNALTTVKKRSVVSARTRQIRTMTPSNAISVGCVRKSLRIDVSLKLGQRRNTRVVLAEDPPLCHVQHAVGIEIDFRHLVGDQDNCQPGL